MDKKQLIFIGKWIAMMMLASFNFLSYLMNGTILNIIMVILIFVYSIYEFFNSLRGRKLHFGIKIYLFTYYLFAVTMLFLGIRSLMIGNVNSFLINLILIAGDVILIFYTLHKLDHNKG